MWVWERKRIVLYSLTVLLTIVLIFIFFLFPFPQVILILSRSVDFVLYVSQSFCFVYKGIFDLLMLYCLFVCFPSIFKLLFCFFCVSACFFYVSHSCASLQVRMAYKMKNYEWFLSQVRKNFLPRDSDPRVVFQCLSLPFFLFWVCCLCPLAKGVLFIRLPFT